MASHLNFDVISLHVNLCKCVSIFSIYEFNYTRLVNSKHMEDAAAPSVA